MAASSGTPLWATFLIAIGTSVATHLLAAYRDAHKRRGETVSAWRKDCEVLLTEIADEAIEYYCDPNALPSTALASQRLLGKLNRLGRKVRDVLCTESRNTKACTDLMQELRDLITLPDDFQLPSRTIRGHTDPLMGQIRDCEDRFRANLALDRKPR